MPQLINIYPFAKFGERIIFHGERTKKQVALTFDDGPSEQTAEISKLLKKNKSKGTFFVLGNKVDKYSKTLKQVVEDGCEIGNHTFSHDRCVFASKARVRKEIIKTNEKLAEIGIKTKLFRPADGRFGFNLISVLKETSQKGIIWDVEPKDWQRPGVEKVIQRILKNVQPGSIICLHDCTQEFGVNRDLKKILEKVAPKLKAMGYESVTVSKLIN